MTDEVSGVEPEGDVAPEEDANVSHSDIAEVDTEADSDGNEAESSPAVTDSDDSFEPEVKGVQKRIDELTRLRRDAERERDRWAAAFERLERLQTQPEAPKQQQEETPKTLADFNYDENAYRDHLFKIAETRAEARAEAVAKKFHREQEAERLRGTFDARARAFAKTVDDYEEVAHYAPISDQVASLVMELEEGPQVAYYLGKNPDVATRVSGLSERMAAIELGRIATRLEARKAKPVSKAPPPPPKIEAENPGNVEKDPAKMTDAEFAKWRRKQIAQRA